jgi:hypothetical protein
MSDLDIAIEILEKEYQKKPLPNEMALEEVDKWLELGRTIEFLKKRKKNKKGG